MSDFRTEVCGHCRFWVPLTPAQGAKDKRGECRIAPPPVLVLLNVVAGQPKVRMGKGGRIQQVAAEPARTENTIATQYLQVPPDFRACARFEAPPEPQGIELQPPAQD